MGEPLDEQYLTWLYSLVAPVRLKNPRRTYWSLASQLHSKEFVWFVPNDDNRLEDGRALRDEFLHAREIENPDPDWLDLGCSMLELLLGLSRRLSFEGEGEPRAWFWHLLDVVDLQKYNDYVYDDEARREIDDALDQIIHRTYAADGRGGLFPLRNPQHDQREVELWYQLNAYLVELY